MAEQWRDNQPEMKPVKPFDDANGVELSQAGSEYLRALWRRREAARHAPFTVSEETLLAGDEGAARAQTDSASESRPSAG